MTPPPPRQSGNAVRSSERVILTRIVVAEGRMTPPARRTRSAFAGVTPRQARLVDWLKHPGSALPDHPAIDPGAAMWTAQEIVDHTGLYTTRAQAMYDLRALRQLGTVAAAGGRWRYIKPHEDIRG
jgi:hypothetical protein